MTAPSSEFTSRHLLYLLVGVALLGVVGVLVFASGLIAPPWAVVLLVGCWAVAAIASAVQWRRRPFLPLLGGVAVGLLWVIVISIGNALLDWRG